MFLFPNPRNRIKNENGDLQDWNQSSLNGRQFIAPKGNIWERDQFRSCESRNSY